MYKIDYKILINGKTLQILDSVTIRQSVENIVSTATIKLPALIYNTSIEQLKEIKNKQKVAIELGYNGKLIKEFDGFVKSAQRNDNGMTIECEDAMFLFNDTLLKDEIFTKTTVKNLLDKTIKQVGSEYSLKCDYDFTYDKFTINKATALDVLKLVQSECHCGIYLKDKELHVHPIYTENFGTAKYDLTQNVQADGFSLIYKDSQDRRLKVIAKGKDDKGGDIEVSVGEAGGDIENFDYKGLTSKDKLTKIANEIYARKCYTGYEGSFQSWLLPFCSSGYSANITNQQEPERSGLYFVKSVETTVSSSGAVRKIELGKKL